MSHVKGHFREWRGKRVWIPDYDNKQTHAPEPPPQPAKAPKSLKPVSMPPPRG